MYNDSFSQQNDKKSKQDSQAENQDKIQNSQLPSFQKHRSFLNFPGSTQREDSRQHQSNYFSQFHGQQYQQKNQPSVISDENKTQTAFLLGTDFSLSEIENKIQSFIYYYKDPRPQPPLSQSAQYSYYINKLQQVKETEQYQIIINAEHIFHFDEALYWKLIFYPAEIIILIDNNVTQIYKKEFLNTDEQAVFDKQIVCQIFNLKSQTRLRDIEPKDINKLIGIKGIVIRTSEIYPEMRDSTFRCAGCGLIEQKNIDRGRIDEPTICKHCQGRGTFELVHNLCQFADKQQVKLQETPDQIPEGETPIHVNLLLYDDIVDTCKPGDSIEITGIYRAQPVRVSRQKRVQETKFKNYVDVVSIQFTNQNKVALDYQMSLDTDKIIFTEQDKREFMEFSKDPNIYQELMSIFAGSLFEMLDIKKGLLCQLFGGTPKDFEDTLRGRFRSELNVLLVGDPSTAKSQFLKCMSKVALRGIFTSGKGSSAVGLTAYISKDPETKELILESGALVLADKGICCIDEFDKMDDNTKAILHEVMEQQTISIAKAGIVCQLNARSAILAAANPIESRYNPKKSLVYNIMLPPQLISRFDLIYLILDQANQEQDYNLAIHILQLFNKPTKQNENKKSQKFLTKYITYAKNICKPQITLEAEKAMIDGYIKMRKQGHSKYSISATPRQLESIIRISESLAKMRLDNQVQVNDVNEAINLVQKATQQAAIDPVTGQIDMNMLATGYSSNENQKVEELAKIIEGLLNQNINEFKQGMISSRVMEMLQKKIYNQMEVDENELYNSLRKLEERRVINIVGDPKVGKYHIKYIK